MESDYVKINQISIKSKEHFANLSLLFILFAAIVFQYFTFRAGNIGIDHALMDNIFRNILDGNGVTSHGTLSFIRNDSTGNMLQIGDVENAFVSHFSVHFDPMLYLFAPFRALFSFMQSGQLIATTVWIFFSIIPAVALIKKIEGNLLIAKYTVAIIFSLPIGFGMLTNVPHPVILAIPFMIAAVYFAFVKKWFLYWIFLFASLLFQESIALFMASLAFMLWRNNKREAILTIIVCAAYFFLSMRLIHIIVEMNNVSLDRLGWDSIAFGSDMEKFGSVTNFIFAKIYENPFNFLANVFSLNNVVFIIIATIVSGNIFVIRSWLSILVLLAASHNQLLMTVTGDMGRGGILYEFHWHYCVYFLIAFFINYAIARQKSIS